MNLIEVQSKVMACIADSLALRPQDVQLTSRLIDDLGADSLDFIDILFSLEKALGWKLRTASVDAFLRAEFSEAQLVDGRFIPRSEVDKLAAWLPAIDEAGERARITPAQIYQFISVETFVRIALLAQEAGRG